MLTCIACSRQSNGGSVDEEEDGDSVVTLATKPAVKSLTSQIKDMALKATGAYRSCKPCTGTSASNNPTRPDADRGSMSGRFFGGHQKTGNSTPRVWGKEMEARLKGISSGASTPVSVSGRTESPVVFMEEDEGREWIAQVEPGVLITFISLPAGGNDIKRIRFSRAVFDKWQAQRWWSENREKLSELYNIQRYNQPGVPLPLPSPPRSEAQSSITASTEASPVTPSLSKEHTPRNFYNPSGIGCSSSDSLDQHHNLNSVPKFSNISGPKTETSSLEASRSTSSSREPDQSGELSLSNASDAAYEFIQQDEPGVYITIRTSPDGVRELRRIRFSRERFGEINARMWWDQNKARIEQQYL